MKELILNRFQEVNRRLKSDYIYDLEMQTERFIPDLSPGVFEKIHDTGDGRLRIYHAGAEIKVVPGFFAKEVPTGKEEIFLEFAYRDNYYHLVGNMDLKSPKFNLKRMDRYKEKSYQQVPLSRNKEAVVYATRILSETLQMTNKQGAD